LQRDQNAFVSTLNTLSVDDWKPQTIWHQTCSLSKL